ncbi:unnamed protein product [Angiostrongylus costaricensis]|uniref:Autophagy-related protein n=1 Tax=Angiostrongylus costaricensis TaxID=334426 RepID=A0A0R3PKA7_ANGCS|nr:unnamed protein product [Angiostrongylus costaricensis]
MMLDESLERAEPTGLLLHVTGKNGRFTGARSSHPTMNGATGDTGDSGARSAHSTINGTMGDGRSSHGFWSLEMRMLKDERDHKVVWYNDVVANSEVKVVKRKEDEASSSESCPLKKKRVTIKEEEHEEPFPMNVSTEIREGRIPSLSERLFLGVRYLAPYWAVYRTRAKGRTCDVVDQDFYYLFCSFYVYGFIIS